MIAGWLAMVWAHAQAVPSVAPAATAEQAAAMSWQSVVPALHAQWSRLGAPAYDHRADAAVATGGALPVGPTSMSWQLQAGAAPGDQLTAWVDIPLTARTAERAAWRARGEAWTAWGDADGLQWAEEALVRYAEVWRTETLVVHLRDWADDVRHALERFEAAAERGAMAAADLADLRGEIGAVVAEVAGAESEAAAARGALSAWVGVRWHVEVGDEAAHDDLPSEDPFAGTPPTHPAITAWAAEVDAAEAQRTATARAGWTPALEAGAMALQVGTPAARAYAPLAFLTVRVPLQPESRAQQQAEAGEIAAARAEADRARRVLDERWSAESEAWQASRAQVERLDRSVVDVLAEREARLVAAFDAGLVTADRLILARRDHPEAEHARIEAEAALRLRTARAALWRAWAEVGE